MSHRSGAADAESTFFFCLLLSTGAMSAKSSGQPPRSHFSCLFALVLTSPLPSPCVYDARLDVSTGAVVDVLLTMLQNGASPFAKEKVQVRLVVTSNWLQFWKKSKKKRLMAVPLSLVWTERELQLTKKNKDVDLNCGFEVVLPSQRWPLIAKTEAERNKLLQSIDDAIMSYLQMSTVPNGTREKALTCIFKTPKVSTSLFSFSH